MTAPPPSPLCLLVLALFGSQGFMACNRAGDVSNAAAANANHPRATGLFWGRVGDVPDGMRVQTWLDSDGTRVRGSYSAVPWTGEIEGLVARDGSIATTFLERGVTRAVGSRTRTITLRWDRTGTTLSGTDPTGHRVDLVRAGFSPPALRTGVWLSRWTGLPYGMAVETRLSHDPDGHWRAVYQYQGNGGVRDGSFDGVTEANGALAIAWTELVESGSLSRGRGRLLQSAFGMRGTYGIEGSSEGIGEWVLEPFGP